MPAKPYRLAIVGIGALGSYFGSCLQQAANHGLQVDGRPPAVSMWGHWPAQLTALQRDGLTITDPNGAQHVTFFATVGRLSQADLKADLVLVLVKSYQTAGIAPAVAKILAPHGLVLTLQNGLGNDQLLAKHIPSKRVIQGVTTQGATLTGPGQLRFGGQGTTFLPQHPCLSDVNTLLNQANLPTRITPNAAGLVWGKLVLNSAINPLAALHQVPNGQLLSRPDWRQTLLTAARETAAVAAAQGIELPFPDPAAEVIRVCHATATNYASMLQDVRQGRPTEIEAINGAIVQRAEQLGVAAPVNRRLWLAMQAKQTG